MTTLAFILVSWRPNAPAGMERAVAASAVGMVTAGHRAVIVTADRRAPTSYASAPVVVLDTLVIPDPCADEPMRAAIHAAGERLQDDCCPSSPTTASTSPFTSTACGVWAG